MASIVSVQPGNWLESSTWDNGVPTSADGVTLWHAVTVQALLSNTVVAQSLNIESDGDTLNGELILADGAAVNLGGSYGGYLPPTFNGTSSLTVTSYDCTASTSVPAGATLTVSGNAAANVTDTDGFSVAGTLSVSGSITSTDSGTGNTVTISAGSVMAGSIARPGGTGYAVNQTGGTVAINGNASGAPYLNMVSATFTITGDYTNSTSSTGLSCNSEGNITVTGNVLQQTGGGKAISHTGSGNVTVGGNVSNTVAGGYGVNWSSTGRLDIAGNVANSASGTASYGVYGVASKGPVIVRGDVSRSGSGGYGLYVNGGTVLIILGTITTNGAYGVVANGLVVTDGSKTLSGNALYVSTFWLHMGDQITGTPTLNTPLGHFTIPAAAVVKVPTSSTDATGTKFLGYTYASALLNGTLSAGGGGGLIGQSALISLGA